MRGAVPRQRTLADPALVLVQAVWAAENLLRGVPRDESAQRSNAEVFTADEARALLDAMAASPFVEASRAIARDAKRWQMIA